MSEALPQVVVAQLGARMHYAVPRILHEAGMLAHFYTDICGNLGTPRFLRAVPKRLRLPGLNRLLGRVPINIPPAKITAFELLGWRYFLALRMSKSAAEASSNFAQFGQEFCEQVVNAGLRDAAAVYCFNIAGLEVLRAAKSEGMTTFLEQTLAPRCVVSRLLEKESRTHPDWSIEKEFSHNDEINAREFSEWNLADWIVCGSKFVVDGIREAGGPHHKCIVMPYGVDASQFCIRERERHHALRILTVGTVGLRKGAPYIVATARALQGKAEFRIIGPGSVPEVIQSTCPSNVSFLGQVPRSEVSRHFQWADVFFFPSICEGSATVTYEALISGLPVICTVNAGSVVRDGIDGFIVPAGECTQAIERMQQLSCDRELLQTLSVNARASAEHNGLGAYAERLLNTIRSRVHRETAVTDAAQ